MVPPGDQDVRTTADDVPWNAFPMQVLQHQNQLVDRVDIRQGLDHAAGTEGGIGRHIDIPANGGTKRRQLKTLSAPHARAQDGVGFHAPPLFPSTLRCLQRGQHLFTRPDDIAGTQGQQQIALLQQRQQLGSLHQLRDGMGMALTMSLIASSSFSEVTPSIGCSLAA